MLLPMRLTFLGSSKVSVYDSVEQAAGGSLVGHWYATRTETNGSGRLRITNLAGDENHLDALTESGEASVSGATVSYDGTDDYSQATGLASTWDYLHDGAARADAFVVGTVRVGQAANGVIACTTTSASIAGVRAQYNFNNQNIDVWLSNGPDLEIANLSYTLGQRFLLHWFVGTGGILTARLITSGADVSDSTLAMTPGGSANIPMRIGSRGGSFESRLDFEAMVTLSGATAQQAADVLAELQTAYELPGA